MKNLSERKAKTMEEFEHLFWLAARDIIFFSTFNENLDDWDDGWHAVVSCNDMFIYATADATKIAPGREHEVREIFEKYGWGGVAAWCSIERKEEPIKEIQDKQYHKALKELKNKKRSESMKFVFENTYGEKEK